MKKYLNKFGQDFTLLLSYVIKTFIPIYFRKLKPKAYAYPEDPQRDPVYLYKMYSDKRPDDMNSEDSPFFLTPGSASQNCWYRRTPMGINKLYGIINDMKEKSRSRGSTDNSLQVFNIPDYLHLQKKSDRSGTALGLLLSSYI